MSALETLLPQLATFPLWPVRDGKCTCRKGAECDTAGKHPACNWSELEAEERWIAADSRCFFPNGFDIHDCGYGIATGHRSGVWALDLDDKPDEDRDGVRNFLRLAKAFGGVPDTLTVATPSGGFHLLFRQPTFGIKTVGNVPARGIDPRGEGGFIVAPGSRHRNGGEYRVARDVEPADAPQWLLTVVQRRVVADPLPPVVPAEMDDAEHANRIARAARWLETKCAPSIQGHRGSTALLRACQALVLDFGFDDKTAVWLIFEHYNPRAVPVWTLESITRKVEHARHQSHRSPRLPPDALDRLVERHAQ